MGIKVGAFLRRVEEIAAEEPSYRLGGYARDGTCDCIGLAIGAIRRAGGEWPGTHGSNYAARHEVQALRRLSAGDILPGMLVLKAKEPGESGYALPSKYAGGGDLRDYYHAGVCVATSPLCIVHSTGTGKKSSIVRDAKQGKWLWGGALKRVEYDADAGVAPSEEAAAAAVSAAATVWSQNGGKVRIRDKPTKSCRLWWWVPYGAEVDVLETDTGSPGWWKVRYGKRVGYIWQDYLAVG